MHNKLMNRFVIYIIRPYIQFSDLSQRMSTVDPSEPVSTTIIIPVEIAGICISVFLCVVLASVAFMTWILRKRRHRQQTALYDSKYNPYSDMHC